ncbi:MAG: vWA domain-containing protein [Myxococcota bacterium]
MRTRWQYWTLAGSLLVAACGARTALPEPEGATEDAGRSDADDADGADGQCRPSTEEVSLAGLDVALLVDRSASLTALATGTSERLADLVYDGLRSFISSGALRNSTVELTLFPLTPPFVREDFCPVCIDQGLDCVDVGLCVPEECFEGTACPPESLPRPFSFCGRGDSCPRRQRCTTNYGFCDDGSETVCRGLRGVENEACAGGGLCRAPERSPCFARVSCDQHGLEPAVPSGPFGRVQGSLIEALTDVEFGGGTPIGAAVENVRLRLEARGASAQAIVLVTDGEPEECGGRASAFQQVSAASRAGIPTYIIGIDGEGTVANSLDELAISGGTGEAFRVQAGADVGEQLGEALALVQRASVCTARIRELEARAVEVELVENGRVRSLDEGCPGGYRVIDRSRDGNPRRIELCPATCSDVLANGSATLRVRTVCP